MEIEETTLKVKMKKLQLLFPFLLALTYPIPSNAQYYAEMCYTKVYVPEGYDRYGVYREGYYAEREVPCNVPSRSSLQCNPTNTLLGAILGGGVAASMSRGDGYKWSVPLGAFVGGTAIGCIP